MKCEETVKIKNYGMLCFDLTVVHIKATVSGDRELVTDTDCCCINVPSQHEGLRGVQRNSK